MSDPGPPGNPFEGMPFLGDLAKMLAGQTGDPWQAARQWAVTIATEGTSEPNVDPIERMKLEELARVADLQVGGITGLNTSITGRSLTVVPVTRAQWAERSLDAYRPLFNLLGESMNVDAEIPDDELDHDDPMTQLLGPLLKMLGPMMLGMTTGSMVGHLAQRSFGQYDLPIPRPPSDELLIIPSALAAFSDEWSVPIDDVRLWILVHEIAHHAVLGVDHIRARLDELLQAHGRSFRTDSAALEERLGSFDPTDPGAMGGMQELFSDPTVLLGMVTSPEQEVLRPQLAALTSVIEGYVDHVMDQVGGRLISSYGMLTEALRRRRVEAAQNDRFVEHILGFELSQAQYNRGAAFIDGVVERAGENGTDPLWQDARFLPTANEVDAPGLWLARIEIPEDPG